MTVHNLTLICWVFAFVLFALAAVGVPSGRVNLVGAGLTFAALAHLVA